MERMGRDAVPVRIAWAVDLLDLHPDHDVLEVGCGTGVALGLIAERLADGTGSAVGLDRSSTAIARSTTRLAAAIDAGRVVLQQAALAQLVAPDDAFDRVLAVNVNVFWTSAADAECLRLRQVVRPGGRVVLAFDRPEQAPGSEGARDVGPDVAAKLEAHGFTSTTIHRHPSGAVIAIEGRRP